MGGVYRIENGRLVVKNKNEIFIIKEEISHADGTKIFRAYFDDGTPVDYTTKKRDHMERYLKVNWPGCRVRYA